MKKNIITLALLLTSAVVMSQTEFDALKYVQTDINGTARYMGMAGAFGALGGDASAIKDNPAGLGIYRRSELTGTLDVLSQTSTSNWSGTKGISDLYKLGFNNFTYVIACPTWHNEDGSNGLQSSNFSFSYNRLKTFDRSLNIKGSSSTSSMTKYIAGLTNSASIQNTWPIIESDLKYTPNYEPFNNTDVPWLSVLAHDGKLMYNNGSAWSSILGSNEKATPNYKLYEKGFVDEYSIGWAGNFSNKLFLGATINLQSLSYSSYSNYSESFEAGGSMLLNDSINTKGTGFNLKLGAIVCPTDYLRLGLSVQTPTVYYGMSDTYNSSLHFNTDTMGIISTPTGSSNYQFQSPLLVNASAAYIIGKKGLISVEYDYASYSTTRLINNQGDGDFDKENDGIRENLNGSGTIKIGGEYKLTDNFSLRAGYANTSNATVAGAAKSIRTNSVRTDTEYFQHNSTNYITAGFGYRESGWFIDFAYLNKILDESFYPYNSNATPVSPAAIISSNNNMVLTLGFKF